MGHASQREQRRHMGDPGGGDQARSVGAGSSPMTSVATTTMKKE
jgi:hypothetical protein